MLTIQDIKFGLLTALARAGRHEHKMNLLGRPNQPGRAEAALGVVFTSDDRALADEAFGELRAAGLLRPTYADVVDPESWVELTDAGRHALETRCLDAVDEVLARIAGHLPEVRRGAWSALASGQPDSLRQAAHSGRELIDQVLKLVAPDEEVQAQDGFQPDRSSKTGVTRRMRLRLVMAKCRGSISTSDLDVADKAADLVLSVADDLTNEAHARGKAARDKVKASLQALESALTLVLLPADR